ncbi:meiotically up-regulated protein (macronuclear) [Tetrahymena thermophila SB210]|uniref:Meiotically up-regulated protein n=1 Tax=Tetrahymena thermophila (strain SB210) TaxID=312017 RepID=I7MEJ4_TETTS|nr:meiotically up-regulated protein [Tetrahymena thermophila SB210]EAR96469.3 meiotically up-regulated protein [Tetrahymena thermophila SB210]|eukprot:XP_001016714.3 meiotically up-regulated protein [Tetrahymena thermophila SB210]
MQMNKNSTRQVSLDSNELPPPDRPEPKDRKFTSEVIEKVIREVKEQLADPVLALMFEQDFPNTLDTTVYYFGKNETTGRPDAFIITGDIQAMWQRDSTNQVLPYLPYVNEDQKLKDLIIGVINRQIHNVLIDPYANAFNFKEQVSPFTTDNTTKLLPNNTRVQAMNPYIWERKYEIDSLAAVLKLQVEFYEQSEGDDSFMHEDYFRSLEIIYQTLVENQLGTKQEDQVKRIPYTFQREARNPTDTLSHGRQNLCTGQGGMIKSAFRPSDDACTFAYFVPGNAMLVTYLQKTADIIQTKNPDLSQKLSQLAFQIKQSIYSKAITKDINGNSVFAYETDGFGNHFKMDDANIPSLLSLPYLKFIDQDDPLYQNTRNMVLDSNQNPYYFSGKDGHGIGGPHVGDEYVWPMAIITRAITSNNDQEILECLEILKTTTAGTYFIHESFLARDSNNFTREWFAWANTYFGELILDLLQRKPYLLTKKVSEK